MQVVKLLRVVVASPGDVAAERAAVESVAEELNRGIGDLLGVRLEVVRWETDAFPGFDPAGSQGQIDRALRIGKADLLVGVFWKRFGTGVPGAASGTEHEIREAYGAWQQSGQPQIMVYFNHQKPTDLSPEEEAQWQAVRRFQADPMFKEGLWWSFENTSHFEKLVRMHLTQYLKHRVTPIECNVRTVETPIGTVDVSHPRPVKPQSLEAIAPALRRHRNTNLGFEIAWPKSGWLVIDDAVRLSMMKSMVSARAGMANPMPLEFALVLLSELDYGVFRPNVNVLAERLAPMTIGDYVDRSKIVMGQAGLQVEGSDHDDATNSGVIVFYGRDPDGRPLFQFQRVLLGSGVALIATASQLPPMNQVGERMRTELAAILNSFRRV